MFNVNVFENICSLPQVASEHENLINLARAATHHVNLGGEEPRSERPPLLWVTGNTELSLVNTFNTVVSLVNNLNTIPLLVLDTVLLQLGEEHLVWILDSWQKLFRGKK